MYIDVEKRGLLVHRGGKKKMEKRANAHTYTYTPTVDSGCVRVIARRIKNLWKQREGTYIS